jgi:hypothetical protein
MTTAEGGEMTTAEGQEFEILRARLQRLERRVLVVTLGWVLSVATFVLLGVAVQQAVSQPEVLRARRIEVVDAAGRLRILLGVLPDGTPMLGLSDAARRLRIGLAVHPNGLAQLTLGDAAGRTRISLALLLDGTPSLFLQDAAGRVLFQAP